MQQRRRFRQYTERKPVDHQRAVRPRRQKPLLRDGLLRRAGSGKAVTERQQCHVPAEPALAVPSINGVATDAAGKALTDARVVSVGWT